MTWQGEMVPIVRQLINDVDESDYTDSELERTILIAALLIKLDVDFDKTYTIDIDSDTLSPDPTADTRDDAFVILVSLKTACIILGAEVKAKAGSSLKVKDGPSSIDTTSSFADLKVLHTEICKKYDEARLQYQLGNKGGLAVYTPYTLEHIPITEGNF